MNAHAALLFSLPVGQQRHQIVTGLVKVVDIGPQGGDVTGTQEGELLKMMKSAFAAYGNCQRIEKSRNRARRGRTPINPWCGR